MSHEDVRKKLRPKRFNKFESDSIKVNNECVPKRVIKRPNLTNSPGFINNKKICYGLMHPPSTTINLANNRMKKLKQNLQEELTVSREEILTKNGSNERLNQFNDGNPKFNDSSGSIPKNPNLKNNTTENLNLSSRILKIKKNADQINEFEAQNLRLKLKRNLPCNNTELKISERLNLKRKCDNPLNFKDNPDSSIPNNPKSPVPKNKLTEIINVDTFNDKMAMTASWIRNHQQFTDILPTNDATKSDSDGCNLDNSEEMEWTNAEPDIEVIKLEKNPDKEIIKSNTENQLNQQINKQDLVETGTVEKDKTKLCIVIDTNIFISELSKLSDILMLKISGTVQPLLYIPWMVITELDEIKDRPGDKKLKEKAFDAIKFINKNLSEENERFKGQTVTDMSNQKHIGGSPDDKIIGCCLQAVDTYESVILLSNDINLKNKALINNITAASANEIIVKIMSKLLKNTKYQKIVQKMSILCSEIICGCAKDAYGDVWSKMDMLSHPPWSLVECLKRFKKYWLAVFSDKVMKHFLRNVDKLLVLMANSKGICDDSENYIEFVKLCLNLCIFLKDIEDFRGLIENAIKDITKIG